MPAKKKPGRPTEPDKMVNLVVRIPKWMMDELDEKRREALLSDRSTLVRRMLARELGRSEVAI